MNKVDDVMSARGWPAIKWEDGGRLLERGQKSERTLICKDGVFGQE